MNLFDKIPQSINEHLSRNAFCISDRYYSYADLAERITGIRDYIKSKINENEKYIGLIANDDPETYAAIFALWLEGKAYVPLNPAVPAERNLFIVRESGIKTVLNSSAGNSFPYSFTYISDLMGQAFIEPPLKCEEEELAYILFTSGTTGIPKGVPVTRKNLNSFSKAFHKEFFVLNENDKWLQMFDLTFDLSIMSFLIPVLSGACIYTIPAGKIRYNYIFRLLDTYELTGALLVPSIINYLRPYFSEIRSENMQYCLFCGEALPIALTNEWSSCIPNADIWNVYGPTENTIFCTSYKFNRKNKELNKSANGILSVGKSMQDCFAIVVTDDGEIAGDGETGELCLAGDQLTPGYWNNPQKNTNSFFNMNYNGKTERFYRTGDLCSIDAENDIMYRGRIDTQVKIHGYRVELSEIEHFAKQFLTGKNVFAASFQNSSEIMEIGLVIESKEFQYADLLEFLKQKLPAYMIPSKVIFKEAFPTNSNGKTDHKQLKQLLSQ